MHRVRGHEAREGEGHISRRKLLRAGVAVAAGAWLRGVARGQTPDEELARTVLQIRGTDAERLVRRAFETLHAERFIRAGGHVVLKPNASFANEPGWGNNTNPAVVRAVAQVCREAGARRVTVIDFPLHQGAEALEQNGVAAACRGLSGVQLRVLSARHQFRPVSLPGAASLSEVEIARPVLDADLFINLPVAKAHDAVAASVGLKNLMGVIWDRAQFHTTLEINQAIADLAAAIRPGLTLVDMTRCMVTNGPKGPGEVERPETLVAAVDPIAADAVAVGLLRFNGRKFRPAQLRYLSLASQRGLGRIELDQLVIKKLDA